MKHSSCINAVISLGVISGLMVGLFLIIKGFSGTFFAASIVIIFLIILLFLNYRSKTTSLFRANIKAYFSLRKMGQLHKEALEGVIQSRYPLSSKNREIVKAMFYPGLLITEKETCYYDKELDIEQLVYTIYTYEIEEPQTWEDEVRIRKKIGKVYNSLVKKYNVEM